MKTRALQRYRADMVADICAWCSDKELADTTALARGYDLNHTICPSCKDRVSLSMTLEGIAQTANPNNPILLELQRLENEIQK